MKTDEMKIAAYLKKAYGRILIPNEEGPFTAEILEFPGCIAEGRSANEAIRNLDKAASSWIKSCLERNVEIPEPSSDYEHSGRVALRLPSGLHRQASQMAHREGTSLNQYLVSAVAARVGASDVIRRMIDQIKQLTINVLILPENKPAIEYANTIEAKTPWKMITSKPAHEGQNG